MALTSALREVDGTAAKATESGMLTFALRLSPEAPTRKVHVLVMTSPGTNLVTSVSVPECFQVPAQSGLVSESEPAVTDPPLTEAESVQYASEPAPPRRRTAAAPAAREPLVVFFMMFSLRGRGVRDREPLTRVLLG